MRIDELKRGFWGYKKDSVYQYIVSLEETASKHAAEKEAKLEKQAAEHEKRVAELEATAAALRAENDSLRENQAMVFSTMLEAQKYADQLRSDSDRKQRQAQADLSAAVQQRNLQLDGYLEQILQIRTMIREILKDFDGKMETVEHTLTYLPTQAPDVELDGTLMDASGTSEASPVSMQRKLQAKPDKSEGDKWKNISFT